MSSRTEAQLTTLPAQCPACGGAAPGRVFSTPRLTVGACACGHLTAAHLLEDAERRGRDYHEQYEADSFLDSLEQTRRRQARRIVAHLRRHLPSPAGLLDFGAGRGWFLDECRAAGLSPLAGADTSALAVEQLRARGFAALQLDVPEGEQWHLPLHSLGFQPEVLSLLDVVEHFPPAHLAGLLGNLVGAVRPRWVVLKVPVATGLLYRTARGLHRLGVGAGPLEQLYQVGTFPAHYSYFTRRSLGRLLGRLGLGVVEAFGDRDFEPGTLVARARALSALPSWVGAAAGGGAAWVASALRLEDSLVVLARPAP